MPVNQTLIILLMLGIAQICCHHHHKSHNDYHLIKILKLKHNFFKEFSRTAQKVVNGLFDSLSVSEQFTQEQNIKILLTMYNDLNNIAEKNFELYDILRNASALDVVDKPINHTKVNELIMTVLNGNEFNMNNRTQDDNFENVQSTAYKKSSSEFADSKEFKAFIGGFIGKLKKLTVEDLFQKKDNANSSEWEQSGRRNIQVWEEPPLDETDKYKMGNRRIFRGETTNIISYPFVVSVHVKGEFSCAGSIISKDLIITAASCLQLEHYTYVRINSDYTTRLGEEIPVLETFLYPEYDPKSLQHNLAILRLQRSLRTSIIQIDRGNSDIPPNAEITILGWGAKKPNQVVNQYEKLTHAELTAFHIDKCKEIYSEMYVTENHFCAGSKSKGSGACRKDVGGPGIIDNLLFGIISFGAPECGDPDAPTVFTRVRLYTDWIDHIVSLRPIKQEIKTNIKPGDKILIYYNTPSSQTDPHMHLVNKYHIQNPFRESFRTKEGDTEEDPDKAIILRQIINDINKKEGMTYDLLNDDLYADFVDIFKSEDKQNILQHPLINKTQYLISGIHYNVPHNTMPPTAPRQYMPTFLLRSTPAEILRST